MLKELCSTIVQNKNLLMLITAGIYVLSLFSTLSGIILPFSIILTLLSIYFLAKNYFPIKYVIVWILIFYFGIANTSLRLRDVDELLSIAPINAEISGTIISIPQKSLDDKAKFFFNVESILANNIEKHNLNEKVFVTVTTPIGEKTDFSELKIYDSYSLRGRLSRPFKAGNPSQFDYGNYLRNFNTYSVFYAKDFKKVDNLVSLKGTVLQGINNYREKVLGIHSKYLMSPNLEILGGIVFGDDAVSPPKNIKDSFINSGLLHILAASGMNVAFIYTFFFLIMSFLKVPFRINILISMLMVIVYTFMTGLGASIIRASLMLIFVLVGKLIDRDSHSVSLLSFVALLMLIYNPMFINDVGFQLSFIVTFGLLMMTPAIVRSENKFVAFLTSTLSIPIIAQLWVIPIQIFYFNNISIYSVFANIISVPVLMIISFGGFVSSLLVGITPISDFLCKAFDFILNPLLTFLVNISEFFSRLPYSSIQTAHPSIMQIILYYLMLLCITGLLYKEIRIKFAKRLWYIFITLLFLLLITLLPVKNTNLEITIFDVGNADAFLIKTPSNKYLMIDTGKNGYNGGKSQAEIIILKYLKDRGIKNLDSIIVTHFDNDHCGGVVDLIKNVKINNLYVNDLEHKSISAKNIYNIANLYGVSLIKATSQQIVHKEKDLLIENFLSENNKNDNENSIITTLRYKNFSMLFTGDADAKILNSLKLVLPKNVTVLKVPHHGAIGGLNNDLIEYFNPKYAVVSVGENKFGHPSVLTLGLLRKSNLLRTDINNSVKFVINEDSYKAYTYNTKKRKYLELR